MSLSPHCRLRIFVSFHKEFNELQSLDISFIRYARLEPANRPIDLKALLMPQKWILFKIRTTKNLDYRPCLKMSKAELFLLRVKAKQARPREREREKESARERD